MNTWRHGDMETWIHEYMYMWIHGDMETWRHGYMNTCICGYMDTWIPGYQDARIPKYMCTWIHGVEVHREPFATLSLFLFLTFCFCFLFYVYFFLSSFWACYWKVESTRAVFLLLTESSPQERCANRHFIRLYLAQTTPLQRDLLLAFWLIHALSFLLYYFLYFFSTYDRSFPTQSTFGRLDGRVEHLNSGTSALREAVTFVNRALPFFEHSPSHSWLKERAERGFRWSQALFPFL